MPRAKEDPRGHVLPGHIPRLHRHRRPQAGSRELRRRPVRRGKPERAEAKDVILQLVELRPLLGSHPWRDRCRVRARPCQLGRWRHCSHRGYGRFAGYFPRWAVGLPLPEARGEPLDSDASGSRGGDSEEESFLPCQPCFRAP